MRVRLRRPADKVSGLAIVQGRATDSCPCRKVLRCAESGREATAGRPSSARSFTSRIAAAEPRHRQLLALDVSRNGAAAKSPARISPSCRRRRTHFCLNREISGCTKCLFIYPPTPSHPLSLYTSTLELTSLISLSTTECLQSLQIKLFFFLVRSFPLSPCLFILNFLVGFRGCYEFQQLNAPNAVHNLASQQNSMRPDLIRVQWSGGIFRHA